MDSESKVRGNSAGIRQVSWRLGAVLAALVWIGTPAMNHAEEAQHQVMTALSSTTLSGYVDTSAIWQMGNGYYYEAAPPLIFKSDAGNFFTGGDISSAPVFASGSGQPDFFGPSGAALEQVPEPSSAALGTLAAALWASWRIRHRRKNG